MISKIKILIKYLLLSLTDNLIINNSKIINNNLLIIRLDAIGDYILFRNFIEILKKSKKYRDYQITFVGNSIWKSLAKEIDREYIDRFIWVDRLKFEKNPFYRYKKLKEITDKGYEIVINPTYSRSFFADDAIVKIINAEEKIGSVGDLSNIKKWQKNISDSYYTKLLSAKDEIMFEFYRHKEFFMQLVEENMNIQKPYIKLKSKKLGFGLPYQYAILFIGANADFRKWSVKNFVEIGRYLKEKYNYEIVLCGGPTDLNDAKKFSDSADYNYIDLVGKTSLVDFLYVINKGNLMISNETSAPHFAVALEMTNIFVISNGNHYGRFIPYPKEIWHGYHPIYHPYIKKDLDSYKRLSNSYGYGSNLNINDISLEQVITKIINVLDKK